MEEYEGKLDAVIDAKELDTLSFSENGFPSGERWPPLGASASPEISAERNICGKISVEATLDVPVTVEPKRVDQQQIAQLQEEKEQLSSSLFALTTRFAQVQFRLHQINEASEEGRNVLLKELDDFANRGCVDPIVVPNNSYTFSTADELTLHDAAESGSGTISSDNLAHQGAIISQLKSQLDDLESFAFKQGAGTVPQSVQLQKQQALLEQLAVRLNLRVDDHDMAHTPVDELKTRVDDAVAEIVNPGKVKAKLVDHLQTQIQDLERFVEFLQIEQEAEGKKSSGSTPISSDQTGRKKRSEKKEALAMVRRALALLNMFTLQQFGCGASFASDEQKPPETTLVSTKTLMANLKRAVIRVRSLVADRARTCDGESDSSSSTSSCDTEDGNTTSSSDEEYADPSLPLENELTRAVRNELCPALRNILAHGLVHDAVGKSSALIAPIACILPRSLSTASPSEDAMHPWELFVEYYRSKNGALLAKAPQRMLTRSFNLEDLVASGDESRTRIMRQSLLEAIHQVLVEHGPLKRSNDDMLKALFCLGLNSGRLSRWVRLISASIALVSNHYSDHSYVARTGLEGVVTVLSRLDTCAFRLPVDVAVRPFKNIRDAF